MSIRAFLAALLVTLSLSAGAEFRTVERAYEVLLSDFQAPATENGMLSLKACRSCEPMSIRVGSGTRYEVNGSAVELAEFKRALQGVHDRDAEGVTVRHHLASDTVTVVSVTL